MQWGSEAVPFLYKVLSLFFFLIGSNKTERRRRSGTDLRGQDGRRLRLLREGRGGTIVQCVRPQVEVYFTLLPSPIGGALAVTFIRTPSWRYLCKISVSSRSNLPRSLSLFLFTGDWRVGPRPRGLSWVGLELSWAKITGIRN